MPGLRPTSAIAAAATTAVCFAAAFAGGTLMRHDRTGKPGGPSRVVVSGHHAPHLGQAEELPSLHLPIASHRASAPRSAAPTAGRGVGVTLGAPARRTTAKRVRPRAPVRRVTPSRPRPSPAPVAAPRPAPAAPVASPPAAPAPRPAPAPRRSPGSQGGGSGTSDSSTPKGQDKAPSPPTTFFSDG